MFERNDLRPIQERNLTSPILMVKKSYNNTRTIILVLISTCICLLSTLDVVAEQIDLPSPIASPLPEGDVPDDCEACKSLVHSFDLGLVRTMRGKHGGGDTNWEEKNLKNYADSEIRLVEIQENLCDELTKGKAQCLKIAEESETDVEEWWFQHKAKNVRLHDFLCINKLKKCCPDNAFGPTCTACLSDCNKRGVCDGSGTRGGTGDCVCHAGYVGKDCRECHPEEFYKMRIDNEDKFECLRCHKACKGGCNGPTSANCTECRAGYSRDPKTHLCVDINECELSPDGMPAETAKRICPDGTYCVNTDGHYKCAACHQVCATCLGYGHDKCITCALNYEMDKRMHICRHFSELRVDETEDSYNFYKKPSVSDLGDPFVIMFFMILVSIFVRAVDNRRNGRPHRDFIGTREALMITSFLVAWLWQPHWLMDDLESAAEDR